MSKIKPMALIESMSGKVCGHSDVYFTTRNGKVYTGKVCNPNTRSASDDQKSMRTKFSTASTNTRLALADAEKRATYIELFGKQKAYKSLRGFVFAREFAKLSEQ